VVRQKKGILKMSGDWITAHESAFFRRMISGGIIRQ
jgi:hypothetical protein